MTLLPKKERERRILDKQRTVLQFLDQFTYSTQQVLGMVMGLRSRQAAHASLCRLESEGLIRRAAVEAAFGRPRTIWGITTHGLAVAFDLDCEYRPKRPFQPSRINALTLQHEIDIQLLYLRAMSAEWRCWKLGAAIQHSLLKYPDALAETCKGEMVAIEVERTVKSSIRYQEIVAAHLAARKAGYWVGILYLTPTADLAIRLERVIHSLKYLRHRGKKIPVRDAHFRPFIIASYDSDWLSVKFSNKE